MTACTCASCGADLDTTQLDFRFTRPDTAPRSEPGREMLLRAGRAGDYTRALLPVRLNGGIVVTFGVWLRVTVADLARIGAAWNTPAYADLSVHGTLANAIQPWGDEIRGAEVRADVHRSGHIPYIVASEHPTVARMLADEWDRDDVLGCFAEPLPVPIRCRINADWTIARDQGFGVNPSKQSLRLVTPGRTVILEPGAEDRTRDELLETLLKGAPPAAGEIREDIPGEIRYAFWLSSGRQHEMYGFVVRDGQFLQVTAIHDDPAHHGWALGAWRSARYQPI